MWKKYNANKKPKQRTSDNHLFFIPGQVQFYLIYTLHENGNSFESTESRKSSFWPKYLNLMVKPFPIFLLSKKKILGEVLNEVLHDKQSNILPVGFG